MNNEDNHKNSFIESPLARWGSFLIALVGLLGFFYDHLIENNPNLTFTIVKEISLLNNKANIPSIHILLDSIDISETNSNLSLYTIKVENEGKQHITKDMYDSNIRLVLKRGEYISLPTITYTSSPHIKPHFIDSTLIADKNKLNIPCISMDKNDKYLFDIIILHPIDSLPSFMADGKISGQKEISISREIKDKPSFWQIAFGGGLWVNIVRLLLYFIFGTALTILLAFLYDNIESAVIKKRKRNKIRKIVSEHVVKPKVTNDFMESGEGKIERMHGWLNSSDEKATKRYKKLKKSLQSNSTGMDYFIKETDLQVAQYLIDNDYITLKDNTLSINKTMRNDFNYVYQRLKKE